jgi:glycosyltransferase involved in cell wall biosynthesis
MKQLPDRKEKITVVLPSYNDREIILPFFEAIQATLLACEDFEFEMIYVDDGSRDCSQEVLTDLALKHDGVVYVELFTNFGQQRALFEGLRRSTGDYVVTLDGDYQYEPIVILQLVRALRDGNYDLASGIRSARKDTISEKLTSKIGNYLIRNVIGLNLKDFGSVKAFSRSLVDAVIGTEHYYSNVYPVAVSLTSNIFEVPVEHKERPIGRSHWNLWDRVKLYLDLFLTHGNNQFDPLLQFGLCVSGLGFFSGGMMVSWKLFLGHESTYAVLMVISFMITLMGISIFMCGLILTLLLKVYNQNTFAAPAHVRHFIEKRPIDR